MNKLPQVLTLLELGVVFSAIEHNILVKWFSTADGMAVIGLSDSPGQSERDHHK